MLQQHSHNLQSMLCKLLTALSTDLSLFDLSTSLLGQGFSLEEAS